MNKNLNFVNNERNGIYMNQILNIDLSKHIDQSEDSHNKYILPSKKHSYKKIFNIQFFLSIIAIFIITSLFTYYKISLNHKEDFSNLLINNYSITQLYSNNTNGESRNNTELEPNSMIGMIEIPVLNISYPIFNELTDELLKTSPCRFFGDFPHTNSIDFNLCITGHNYDNDKFFNKIKDLKTNDKIYIYDTFDNQYVYSVIKNYEVKPDDLSPVYHTTTGSFELTLVTCNNFNGNRIIIKAKIEDV